MGESYVERTWIVLLEAARTDEAPQAGATEASAVLRAMGHETGVGLHSPDRIAVQVSVPAADVATAVATVLDRWRGAALGVGLEDWDVLRAEVVSPEEFDREFHGL